MARSALAEPTGRCSIDILVQSRVQGAWTVVEVKGEVDLYTAPKLREEILSRVESGDRKIVVDLGDVGFLDSTGLGVLVGALKRLKEQDGTLALVCPQGAVLRVLQITGLDRVFPIHESVDQALAT